MENFDQDQNKREHFRVDDNIELSYIVLDEDEPESLEPYYSELFITPEAQIHFDISQQFHSVDQKINNSIQLLQFEQPNLSKCLESINDKFTLITKHLLKAHERPIQWANLSLGGVAFNATEAMNVETSVLLKIILRPTYYGFTPLVKVISCHRIGDNDDGEALYRISAKFHELVEEDEHALSQHINHLQSKHSIASKNELDDNQTYATS